MRDSCSSSNDDDDKERCCTHCMPIPTWTWRAHGDLSAAQCL
jgi:hypothetical protein